MSDLTAAQAQVLSFIERYRAINQMPPTRVDIARHFGWASANAAQEHLEALVRKGFVRLMPGKSRGIFVLRSLEAA